MSIEKGDWVRITRLCKQRGRFGEVVWVLARSDENYVQYHVELFGEPGGSYTYFFVEIEKINEMEVIAEAAR